VLEENGVAVIISDQRMPGLTGDEFLRRASTLSYATRMLITGYSDWDALVRAVNDGKIYSYVQKPWDPAELKMKVAKAVEHYQLQIELARERHLLRTLMDGVPDTIFFKDTESRFFRINPSLARLLGVSSCEEAVGKTEAEFFEQAFAAANHAEEQEIIRSLNPVRDKVEQVRRPGGEVSWHSTTKAPIIDTGGRVTGIIGISRDITARKVAEELMIRHAEEIERLAFVSAHDLQEPLRVVSSFAQLLSRRYKGRLDADADEYVCLMVGAASRMSHLISDLLEYSRTGRRERPSQQTDCNVALEEARNMLRVAIDESGAEITFDPLPTIRGDSMQMAQLFQNLLSNAVKFRAGDAPRVHVTAQREGDSWIFKVRDNGIGIDAQYSEQIFRVFERLHRREEYPGTGIGLAICKTIVERHGGRIWVEPSVGKGTTVFFSMPAQ
jgi:PAS domain S-box-containing protein